MLGWDLRVLRGATVDKGARWVEGGEVIHYTPPTSDCDLFVPVEDAAIEKISTIGYPSIYTLRAGDFPYEALRIPEDEIVTVVMWDQS